MRRRRRGAGSGKIGACTDTDIAPTILNELANVGNPFVTEHITIAVGTAAGKPDNVSTLWIRQIGAEKWLVDEERANPSLLQRIDCIVAVVLPPMPLIGGAMAAVDGNPKGGCASVDEEGAEQEGKFAGGSDPKAGTAQAIRAGGSGCSC